MSNTKRNLKSIEYILFFFPSIKPYLNNDSKGEKILLNEVEQTFLEMCLFFLNPSKISFDFRSVYLYLKGEWVVVAIKSLEIFAKEDSYLINKPSHSIIGKKPGSKGWDKSEE